MAKYSNIIINDSNFNYVTNFETNIDDVLISDSTFIDSSFNDCKLRNFNTDKSNFSSSEFFNTLLKDIDFSTSDISNIRLSDSLKELKGIIVDTFQAAELSQYLGIIIKR